MCHESCQAPDGKPGEDGTPARPDKKEQDQKGALRRYPRLCLRCGGSAGDKRRADCIRGQRYQGTRTGLLGHQRRFVVMRSEIFLPSHFFGLSLIERFRCKLANEIKILRDYLIKIAEEYESNPSNKSTK